MKELVFILLKKDSESLGEVRCIPDLRVAVHEEKIWLRGIPADPELSIRKLPAVETYFLDAGNRLFAPGSLTPCGKLPEETWLPLTEFCSVELPVSALPGELKERELVRLVRTEKIEKGHAVLTTLAHWKSYAEHAPEIRLRKTRFAVSEDDRVIIISDPPVPVPGKEFHLRDSILLPNGYDFDPPVISSLIRDKLNPEQDALLLYAVDGTCERIPLNHFVQGKRSAVRMTKGDES